MQHTSS